MVELFQFHKLPHEILDCERVYPGLLDDIATQLGYRAYMKRELDDDA